MTEGSREHLFCRAALAGEADAARAILVAGGDLDDVGNRRGMAPLHWVLDFAYGRARLDELLRRGADPNARAGPERESALHDGTPLAWCAHGSSFSDGAPEPVAKVLRARSAR
jgi:hypothetical protein